jgi:hypothetical protein
MTRLLLLLVVVVPVLLLLVGIQGISQDHGWGHVCKAALPAHRPLHG